MYSTGFGRIVNCRKWFSSDLLDYSVTLRQHEAVSTSQPPSPGVRASSYLQFYNGAVLFKDFNFVFHHGWSMAEPQEMATVNFFLTSPALEYFLMTRQIPRFSGIMGPFESDWGGRWSSTQNNFLLTCSTFILTIAKIKLFHYKYIGTTHCCIFAKTANNACHSSIVNYSKSARHFHQNLYIPRIDSTKGKRNGKT